MRPVSLRRQSPVRDATAPGPDKLCPYLRHSLSGPYKARVRRKYLPDPISFRPAWSALSAVVQPECDPSPAVATTHHSWDAPAACARNPSARARAVALVRPPILPPCTDRSHQNDPSTISCPRRWLEFLPVRKCTACSAGEMRRYETSHRPSNHPPW